MGNDMLFVESDLNKQDDVLSVESKANMKHDVVSPIDHER